MPLLKSLNYYLVLFGKIHGDKYLYDRSYELFRNSSTPIWIGCKKHGYFLQSPNSHSRGANCRKCAYKEMGEKQRRATIPKINRFKSIHGEKYDYSLIPENPKWKDKVEIICKTHGIFNQSCLDHFHGNGCPLCARQSSAIKHTHLQDDIINIFKNIHGNYYDYSLVEYNKNRNKIIIICPKHGPFHQTPHSHSNGSGCPSCSRSKGEIFISKYLDRYNICYETEKSFCDLKGINRTRYLYFDFYIPAYNLIIEFDGGQHFQSVKFFGGEKAFLKTQERDQIKNQYCLDKNIKLLRISDINQIENVLSKEILL